MLTKLSPARRLMPVPHPLVHDRNHEPGHTHHPHHYQGDAPSSHGSPRAGHSNQGPNHPPGDAVLSNLIHEIASASSLCLLIQPSIDNILIQQSLPSW